MKKNNMFGKFSGGLCGLWGLEYNHETFSIHIYMYIRIIDVEQSRQMYVLTKLNVQDMYRKIDRNIFVYV